MKGNIAHSNAHPETVCGFGDEWTRFNQTDLSATARQKIFAEYFNVLPPGVLNPNAHGADFGVGSGRWATVVAPQVASLACVDASKEALDVAEFNLAEFTNCEFYHSTLDNMPIADASLDFAYCLGVLHHIPDATAAMRNCVRKLKPNAPFLVYLYYSFDNKPRWYAALWSLSEAIRGIVSRLSYPWRYRVSQAVAISTYFPLARFARLLERLGMDVENIPLSYYRSKPFYVMRTDALDRFGTQLEQRFTKSEIQAMMQSCGLDDIVFSDSAPFWCAVGWKKES